MQDLVEDALRNADDKEADISVVDPDVDEFGTPICAVVGCGTAGINRVELVDNPDATAVIGDPEMLDKVEVVSDSETQIPVVTRDHASEYRVLNYPDLESAVAATVGNPDTVVVTGHLDTTESIQIIDTVCR